MSRLLQGQSFKLYGDVPITMNALGTTRSHFFNIMGNPPETLYLSPSAKNELLSILNIKLFFNDNTVMGLEIKIDADLDEGQWLVGKEVSVVTEA